MKSKLLLKQLAFFSVGVLAIVCPAFGQSTSQSSPTEIPASGYSNSKGPSKETIYFFGFTAGPGDVTVTLEIKAKTYSTFARMEIFDAEMNTVATSNMNAATTTGSSSVVKTISLADSQKVLIKLTLDGNLASYKITLGGAVNAGGSSSDTDGSSGGTINGKPNSIPFKDVDISKLPKPVSVPKSGTLVVLMKDGSKQKFDLAEVKSVTTTAN
jgi:hypothetical protein